MENRKTALNRRRILQLGLITAGGVLTSTLGKAQTCELKKTPDQPEGPFYPIQNQPDKDTDLIFVNGSRDQALGKIIIVQGQVVDQFCRPVEGVLVEIWQACHTGRYNHPSDPNESELDPNFQYWGKAVTDFDGKYRFRTVVPGAYQADVDWMRPPHIHFKVHKRGIVELITQMYFAGDALNDKDLILNRLNPNERENVIIPLLQTEDEDHPVANFDISIERITSQF